jgi:hypothetical protein
VTKIRVDMTELTLGDMVEIEELTGKPMTEILASARGVAAAAWLIHRRVDPAFTYEQALALSPLRDLEVVNADAEGEAHAAGNGGEPVTSPASGV